MRVRRLLPVLSLMALLPLAACDVVGGEWNTTIDGDGSGFTQIGIGYLPEDGTVDCSVDEDVPPGAQVGQEMRGAETWCLTTWRYATLDDLRDIYREIGSELLQVHCLEIADDALYYDVELVPTESDDSGGGEGAIHWRVTAPGTIGTNNATSVDGNTLTWTYTGPGSPLRFRVNTSLDEVCPSSAVHLVLDVNDDGTGTATLSFPPLRDGDQADEVNALSDSGWSVDRSPAQADPAGEPMRAGAEWTDLDGLRRLIQSIPGLVGSGSNLALDLTEDSATGQITFDLHGRLDLERHVEFWGRVRPDSAVPPFVLEYLPAGTVENVSGAWTDAASLTFTWIDQDPTSVPLRAVSVLQPELEPEIDADLTADLLEALQQEFLDEIPAGQVTTNPTLFQRALGVFFARGKVNNMTNWTTFACGDYQTRVIKWLDAIRTDPDPAVRAQLVGLDYGPIQAYRGGHQAVVVFPRGTNWQETGTVFDPWPNQRPEVWTMERWTAKFWWGVGVGEGGRDYPHMYGNPSHYAGTTIPLERLHPRKIAVNSPVAVLVVAGDGRELGMTADGEFVNEIQGADFYPTPRGDGEYTWYFGLPEGDYDVRFTGTADGDMHVLVADEDGHLVTYGPQPIERGGTAVLEVNQNSIEEPLHVGGDAVAPIRVTEENIGEIDFGEPESGLTAPVAAVRLGYLVVLAGCLIAPFAAALLFFATRKPKRSLSG